MQQPNDIKVVTIRIGEEDRQMVLDAMRETGNHTASKALLQILRNCGRLLETNHRLMKENEKLRKEIEKTKRDATILKNAAIELKKSLVVCEESVDLTITNLDSLETKEKKKNKPPKGWGRKK